MDLLTLELISANLLIKNAHRFIKNSMKHVFTPCALSKGVCHLLHDNDQCF